MFLRFFVHLAGAAALASTGATSAAACLLGLLCIGLGERGRPWNDFGPMLGTATALAWPGIQMAPATILAALLLAASAIPPARRAPKPSLGSTPAWAACLLLTLAILAPHYLAKDDNPQVLDPSSAPTLFAWALAIAVALAGVALLAVSATRLLSRKASDAKARA